MNIDQQLCWTNSNAGKLSKDTSVFRLLVDVMLSSKLIDSENQDCFVISHFYKLLLTCITWRVWMVGLDKVPNLENLAKDFRSKKEELEAEFKKATEDGLKKYKTWIEKVCNAH